MKERNARKLLTDLNNQIITSLIKSMKKDDEFRLVLSVPEVAKLLRINKTKIYQMVKTNSIPNHKYGNRIIIPITALVEWLDQAAWEKIA